MALPGVHFCHCEQDPHYKLGKTLDYRSSIHSLECDYSLVKFAFVTDSKDLPEQFGWVPFQDPSAWQTSFWDPISPCPPSQLKCPALPYVLEDDITLPFFGEDNAGHSTTVQ